jgi:hypothetical protein
MYEFDTLPKHWKEWIEDYSLERSSGSRKRLNAYDFIENISISFSDNSFCFFRCALCYVDDERRELAVFTEHCGYYIFSIADEDTCFCIDEVC